MFAEACTTTVKISHLKNYNDLWKTVFYSVDKMLFCVFPKIFSNMSRKHVKEQNQNIHYNLRTCSTLHLTFGQQRHNLILFSCLTWLSGFFHCGFLKKLCIPRSSLRTSKFNPHTKLQDLAKNGTRATHTSEVLTSTMLVLSKSES